MRARDRVALALSPVFLRVLLAVTFVWAGLGKLLVEGPVEGRDAAILANMGVISGATAPGVPGDGSLPPPVETPPQAPTEPLPPTSEPETDGDEGGQGGGTARRSAPPEYRLMLTQGATDSPVRSESPAPSAQVTPSLRTYSAADFPDPVPVRGVYHLALDLYKAANPGPDPTTGQARRELWPPGLAVGGWPVGLAWAATLTALLGGVLVLIGFLTRLASFGLAMVMLGAMWLTQLGPAVQSGATRLGFLPVHETFDPAAWMPLMWAFALFMAAMALVFSGAGALSLDRGIFHRRNDEGEGDA